MLISLLVSVNHGLLPMDIPEVTVRGHRQTVEQRGDLPCNVCFPTVQLDQLTIKRRASVLEAKDWVSSAVIERLRVGR